MRFVLIFVVCFSAVHGWAQQALTTAPGKIGVSVADGARYYYGKRNEAPRGIEFKEKKVTASQFLASVNQYLNVPAEFSFVEQASNTDQLGMKHRELQQYYQGLPIEGLVYRVHEKQGIVTSANGRAIREINLTMNTSITEERAFHLAVRYVNGKDSVFRTGRRLIVSKNFAYTPGSFAVAYQFDIDVSLIEQWRISIDARTGDVINKVSLVQTCGIDETPPVLVSNFSLSRTATPWLPYSTGTGLTNYYGRQTIRVEKTGESSSQLIGQSEHGGLLKTYDFRNVSILSLLLFFQWHKAYLVSSYNNIYDQDYVKPAVSAQWAAEKAYEYYYTKHNRNSYDNHGSAIVSYVHVDVNMNNAFWTHNLLAFGDGNNNNPLVELDIVSHELTHGVTQFEARLEYYNEPGALNESFSDILGKAVEFDAFGDTATWIMGKHFGPGGVRNIANPNLKNQPDTYGGEMWYVGSEDGGGVHTNSGVQNYWFYLLSEGGSGVNDQRLNYSVNAIGIDAAARIAYRNLTEYLGPQSEYLDSRIGSMLAAADLYGQNSAMQQEVDKAWDAVGVIDEPIITNLQVFDITATTVNLKGSLQPRGNTVTYHFEYGTTPALGTLTTPYQYNGTVTGQLTGLQSETKYYANLVATNENGSSTFPVEFTTLSLQPLVKIKETVDVTETSASLHGQINPNSLATSFVFEYGTTPALGSVTPTFLLSNGTEYVDVSAAISNLEPRTTYYYRLKATNSHSTSITGTVSFFTAAKPVITSFAPVTGPIGTVVTISGSNFNPQSERNEISFGATKGKIMSSTTTEIKVELTAGASLASISLLDTESGLMTESIRQFVPTFNEPFSGRDMHLIMGVNDVNVYETAVQDMDGDNKPDIVARHYLGFSVYQNVNQGGDITEESFVRRTFNSESSPGKLALVDFDGNGLKDVTMWYQGALRIYPNQSVPGFVFFGTPVDIPNTADIRYPVYGDFDHDGHIDVCYYGVVAGQGQLTFIRNENPSGSLVAQNFSRRYTIPVSNDVWFLNSDDLNNDGKPDLLIGTYGASTVLTLKNISSPGAFAFEENTTQDPSRGRFARYFGSDLNDDGWKDIVQHSPHEAGSLSVFENKAEPDMSFESPAAVLSQHTQSSVEPADFNGDGKIDLVVGTDKREIVFLSNKGATGQPFSNVSFENVATRGMRIDPSNHVDAQLTINDLNGDGRPEVINTYSYYYGPRDGYIMEIWQNSPVDCLDPALVKVEVEGRKATILLPTGTTMEDFEIEYTDASWTSWTPAPQTIEYLSLSTRYRLRVRARCYLEYTDYAYTDFATDCVDLSYFEITTGIDRATLDWYSSYYFETEYSLEGENDWIAVPQYTTLIDDLLAGTTYDVRFRGRCSTLGEFTYQQFTTQCPGLGTLSVSAIDDDRAKIHWYSSYEGEVYLEYSSDNENWTEVDKTESLSSLLPSTIYFVRGRMACQHAESDFVVVSFMTKCQKIEDLTIDAITPNTARVSWTDSFDADEYILSYQLTSGGVIRTFTLATTSYQMIDLNPGASYEVSVSAKCANGTRYETVVFNTFCFVPYNLSVDQVDHTTARLSWNSEYNAVSYVIDYSIAGVNKWKSVKSTETGALLTDLRPGTEYEARVRVECVSASADYVAVDFKTLLYDETRYGPNPTPDKITLQPSKNLIGNRFVLSDYSGKVLFSGALQDYTIDLSMFSRGVYTLMIDGEPPIRIVRL